MASSWERERERLLKPEPSGNPEPGGGAAPGTPPTRGEAWGVVLHRIQFQQQAVQFGQVAAQGGAHHGRRRLRRLLLVGKAWRGKGTTTLRCSPALATPKFSRRIKGRRQPVSPARGWRMGKGCGKRRGGRKSCLNSSTTGGDVTAATWRWQQMAAIRPPGQSGGFVSWPGAVGPPAQ